MEFVVNIFCFILRKNKCPTAFLKCKVAKKIMIRTWNYLDGFENDAEEILSAVKKVLFSGKLIFGESGRNFEEKFSNYCGVKYGIGVNSGTDALFLILKALNITQNDEVITVSNTAIPTVSAIVSTGARPVFVDIDENSYLISVDEIEEKITKHTKCILVVHLYGQCADMNTINELAKKYNLKVVEDCAQACGATFFDKKAGSMSDAAAFSFYPTKILGGYGDAGMIITNNVDTFNRAKRLRFYGIENNYYSVEHGYNSRLDEIHAEILLTKLQHIEEYIEKRINIANIYLNAFADSSLILPNKLNNRRHVYNLFNVRNKNRKKILEFLAKNDIILDIDYPYPIHLMKAYKYLGYSVGDLPNIEKVAKEIFSLPMYPNLTIEKCVKFIETFKKIL